MKVASITRGFGSISTFSGQAWDINVRTIEIRRISGYLVTLRRPTKIHTRYNCPLLDVSSRSAWKSALIIDITPLPLAPIEQRIGTWKESLAPRRTDKTNLLSIFLASSLEPQILHNRRRRGYESNNDLFKNKAQNRSARAEKRDNSPLLARQCSLYWPTAVVTEISLKCMLFCWHGSIRSLLSWCVTNYQI